MATRPSSRSARTPVPWQRLASLAGPANATGPRRTSRPAVAARPPPHQHEPSIIANRLILLPPQRQAGAGQNHQIENLLSRRSGTALTAPVILTITWSRILRII